MQKICSQVDDRINHIHRQYADIIAPHVSLIEVLDGEFPIEVLNEIRAVFGHLTTAHLSDDDNVVESQLSKADAHIKRAILDCYKYSCMALDDQYKTFDRRFQNVDLSLVDNGDFLPELCRKRSAARAKLFDAKTLELCKAPNDDLYGAFESAFEAHSEVYKLVNESFEKLERLRQKTIKRDRWRRFHVWFCYFLGVAGLVATIYSLM